MYNEGIILEITDKYIIVMKKGGNTCRIINKGNSKIGEKIYFLDEDVYNKEVTENKVIPIPFTKDRKINRSLLEKIGAMAAVMLLCIGMFSGPIFTDKAYATVSLDGNNSMQIEIDKKGKIVDIVSYEGKFTEEEISAFKGESIEDFWQFYFNENHDNVVLVGYATNNGKAPEENKLKEELMRISQGKNVIYVKGEKTDTVEASKLEQSLGKYLVNKFGSLDNVEDFLEDSTRKNVEEFLIENSDEISPEKAQMILEYKDKMDLEDQLDDNDDDDDDDDQDDDDDDSDDD